MFKPAFAAALVAFLAASLTWCGAVHAYKTGDALEPAVVTRLQIDPAKITVVSFFAEWCVSCRKELPLVSALYGKVDKKRVDFVGVDTDENAKVAEAFQKEMRDKGALTFRSLSDTDQAVVRSFKPRGFPALYVLKDGKVVAMHLGAMPNVDAVLEQSLKQAGGL